MKLSISNIAWTAENDDKVYSLMHEYHFDGIEIAPTRIIKIDPYDHPDLARKWYLDLHERYGFEVSSIQSIWFGRSERLFGAETDREFLINYTKKAIDWAASIGCKNLVFGCPKNRNKDDKADLGIAISFFRELGSYASDKNCIIGIEANPVLYGTNYINTTREAVSVIREVNSPGIGLNLDLGTIIANDEDINYIMECSDVISHVHISEPGLEYIKKNKIAEEVIEILKKVEYEKYISIEMSNKFGLTAVMEAIQYIAGLRDI